MPQTPERDPVKPEEEEEEERANHDDAHLDDEKSAGGDDNGGLDDDLIKGPWTPEVRPLYSNCSLYPC